MPGLCSCLRGATWGSQYALAGRADVDESVVAQIESSHSPDQVDLDVLSRFLRATEMRPAVALGFYASQLRELAHELGLETVKVFGSVVRGLDTAAGDVDFLVALGDGISSFALAGFQMTAQCILQFPVDVILDGTDGPIGGRVRAEAVPL